MNSVLRWAILLICAGIVGLAPAGAETPNRELAKEILANEDLPKVLARARALLGTGLNAGRGYGEVWIRDLNTFIEQAEGLGPLPRLGRRPGQGDSDAPGMGRAAIAHLAWL